MIVGDLKYVLTECITTWKEYRFDTDINRFKYQPLLVAKEYFVTIIFFLLFFVIVF